MSGVRQVSEEMNVIHASFYVPPPEENLLMSELVSLLYPKNCIQVVYFHRFSIVMTEKHNFKNCIIFVYFTHYHMFPKIL